MRLCDSHKTQNASDRVMPQPSETFASPLEPSSHRSVATTHHGRGCLHHSSFVIIAAAMAAFIVGLIAFANT